jgi:hypothetical protein
MLLLQIAHFRWPLQTRRVWPRVQLEHRNDGICRVPHKHCTTMGASCTIKISPERLLQKCLIAPLVDSRRQ